MGVQKPGFSTQILALTTQYRLKNPVSLWASA